MRFLGFQGIGYLGRPAGIGNHPKRWAKWPYAVLQGPSGQLVQILPPSGIAGKIPTADQVAAFHSNECTMNHSCVAWKRRHLVFVWCDSKNTSSSMRCYAWSPEPQEARKVNPSANVNVDTNTNVKDIIVADGFHWELWNTFANIKDHAALFAIHDGILWVKRDNDTRDHWGIYKGKIPYKLSTVGYFWASAGNYGNQGDLEDAGWSRLPECGASTRNIQDGVDFSSPGSYPANISHNLCEIVKHNDTFYVIGQGFVKGMTIGCKGNFIHHDYGIDNRVAVGSLTGYAQRKTNDVIGATMRSACVHNDKVWMLTNEGKVYEIRPGGLVETADLTTVGAPWASGITGGQLGITPPVGDWQGATAFRPLIRSFNNQLHAFLNFRTSYKIARGKGNFSSKTQGAGICWLTSFDGTNWHDRSEMLPTSGIITPSGGRVPKATWLSQINPYMHSAFTNTNYPSGYGPKAPKTNFLGQSAPMSQGAEARPSGLKQITLLPFWSSGNLLDVEGTKFNLLKTPLSRGALSGCLFPTFIAYPSGYAFVNPLGGDALGFLPQASGGVWRPIRGAGNNAGASGWDYTGCSNYHIGGLTDNDTDGQPFLRLYFSRNFVGTTPNTSSKQIPTLFYTLTKESGFLQVNEAWNAGQLNGACPVELYDYEVIVPSGDMYNPNPRVDTINKLAKLDFTTTDWWFWEPCKVNIEYSTDGGLSWFKASTSGQVVNLSTGTSITDPSGVGISAAQNHTVYWEYGKDLSKNTLYHNVKLRIRAVKP